MKHDRHDITVDGFNFSPAFKTIYKYHLFMTLSTSFIDFINELITFVELIRNLNPLNKKKTGEKGLLNIIDFIKCIFHP
jgi:hypothetical protein